MSLNSLYVLHRTSMQRMVRSALFVVCAIGLLVSRLALAGEGIWANCERSFQDAGANSNAYQYFDGGKANLGRDVQIGQTFGPWFVSRAPAAWHCTPVSSMLNQPYQTAAQAMTGMSLNGSMTVEEEGQKFAVYRTYDLKIGFIVRYRYWINGETSDWVPVNAGKDWRTPQLTAMLHKDQTPFDIGVETHVKLVRTMSSTVAAGIYLSRYPALDLRIYQTNGSKTVTGSSTNRESIVRANSIQILLGGTCTTPDVMVDLPDAPLEKFTGVGSVAVRKGFELAFNECPAGLGDVSYSFTSTTGVLSAADGVVKLDDTSTAKGVGVQFLMGDSEPLKFESAYLLKTYDTATGGNYKVPMTAGLYQSDKTVEPGTANSSITFAITYK